MIWYIIIILHIYYNYLSPAKCFLIYAARWQSEEIQHMKNHIDVTKISNWILGCPATKPNEHLYTLANSQVYGICSKILTDVSCICLHMCRSSQICTANIICMYIYIYYMCTFSFYMHAENSHTQIHMLYTFKFIYTAWRIQGCSGSRLMPTAPEPTWQLGDLSHWSALSGAEQMWSPVTIQIHRFCKWRYPVPLERMEGTPAPGNQIQIGLGMSWVAFFHQQWP